MQRISGPGATVDHKFTEGSPVDGIPATTVTGAWLTTMQEEVAHVIEAASLALDPANNGQLYAAIISLIAGGGTVITAAGVTVADALGLFATDNVEVALAQLATKLYNGTLNANQILRSVISLTATAVNLDSTHCENIVQLTNVAAIAYTIVPDATYNAPIGTAITLFQGGAGQVTVTPGAGVTLKYPSTVFSAKSLAQESNMVLVKVAANTWRLGGMLAAA